MRALAAETAPTLEVEMIRIGKEKLYALKQLLCHVPPRRTGKQTHLSTLLRWIQRGARSRGGAVVKLEATRLGNRWVASIEALQRFADRLVCDTRADEK
jgi:hypothetical protein